MRSTITLFEDQYLLYKELKSKRLLVAFVEFMFEDVEPEWLKWVEKAVFNSLRKRMEKSKLLQERNSRWWQSSHWWWRPWNNSSDADWENSLKTTKQTTKEQPKNKEVEEEVIKENIKRKGYWEFGKCMLSETEHEQIMNDYWTSNWTLLINQVDNYCASKWKKYKNYVAAIRNFAKTAGIKKITPPPQSNDWIYDLPF